MTVCSNTLKNSLGEANEAISVTTYFSIFFGLSSMVCTQMKTFFIHPYVLLKVII